MGITCAIDLTERISGSLILESQTQPGLHEVELLNNYLFKFTNEVKPKF